MKKAFHHVPGIFLLLFLLWMGTIPFVMSFLIRLGSRRLWVACLIAVGLTVAITFYSSAYPDTFRFGSTDLRIHDKVRMPGVPSVAASAMVNLIHAWLGILIGSAARLGYDEGKIGP